jgi:hypothetical protein
MMIAAQRSRSTILPLALIVAMALFACHKSEAPPAEQPAPPVAPVATPAPAAGVTVVGVSLGKSIGADKKVGEPTDSFAKADTIYASVATTGSAPSATLAAHWTFAAKSGEKSVKEDSQTIAPTGDAVTEFHISKPDGWPPGDYKIEVLLDGKSVATKQFKVS